MYVRTVGVPQLFLFTNYNFMTKMFALGYFHHNGQQKY